VAFGGLNERHRRISIVFATAFYFPKLDVAGSNPVSRSNILKDLSDLGPLLLLLQHLLANLARTRRSPTPVTTYAQLVVQPFRLDILLVASGCFAAFWHAVQLVGHRPKVPSTPIAHFLKPSRDRARCSADVSRDRAPTARTLGQLTLDLGTPYSGYSPCALCSQSSQPPLS